MTSVQSKLFHACLKYSRCMSLILSSISPKKHVLKTCSITVKNKHGGKSVSSPIMTAFTQMTSPTQLLKLSEFTSGIRKPNDELEDELFPFCSGNSCGLGVV